MSSAASSVADPLLDSPPVAKQTNCAVQVAVRIRPLNKREAEGQSQVCCRNSGNNVVTLLPPVGRVSRRSALTQAVKGEPNSNEKHVFTFDYVYGDLDGTVANKEDWNSQERIFKDLGSIVLENAFAGFNCSLLAYGQTGAGKTHTIMGYSPEVTIQSPNAPSSTPPSFPSSTTAALSLSLPTTGLVPRICHELFARVEANKDNPNLKHKVEVSYLEIYSEKIQDLLDRNKKNLQVRQHPKKGPYVEGLTVAAVSNYAELEKYIAMGNLERTVAATNMNEKSSRSHAVFTIHFTTTHVDEEVKLSSDVGSKIQLVDLSGSERVEFSGATGLRLKEASMINKSLSTLGRVVSALALRSAEASPSPGGAASPAKSKAAMNDENDPHYIPFRDSVLTWLLKESLGGNAKTLMMACVSPADQSYEETLSTLRYASRAKKIVNAAVVNEDPNGELIRSLRNEINLLRGQLSTERSGGAELNEESARMIAKLRDQLLENARRMQEMEEIWQAKLEATRRENEEEMERQKVQVQAEKERIEREKLAEIEAARAALAAQQAAAAAKPVATPTVNTSDVSPAEDLSAAPFLVNLNERPQAGEGVLHHLHKGSNTVTKKDATNGAAAPVTTVDENFILLPNAGVRERHAQFIYENDTVTLKYIVPAHLASASSADSSSAAAAPASLKPDLFVNNVPVFTSRVLQHGDRVLIGSTAFFRFSISHQELERVMAGKGSPVSPLSSTRAGGKGISIHSFKRKATATEPLSPSSISAMGSPVPAPTPSPVAASGPSKEWNSWLHSHVLDAAMMEALVAREMKLLPKHKQKKAAPSALSLYPANIIALTEDVLLKWRYVVLRKRMDQNIQKMAFMVDEANAMCSAMGMPDRYRIELHSRFAPNGMFNAALSPHAGMMALDVTNDSLAGYSPLSRLRSLRQVTLGVVAWRRRLTPLALSIWEESSFAEQLLLLRTRYAATVEASDVMNSPNSQSAICQYTHGGNRLHLLGSAGLYLVPLRFGCRFRHKTPVLDRRGELAGFLTVELLIRAVDPAQAAHELEKQERREKLEREGKFNEADEEDAEEKKGDSAAAANGVVKPQLVDVKDSILSVTVRILSFDASRLTAKGRPPLAAQGCTGLKVRYQLHDDPHIHSTRSVKVSMPSAAAPTTAANGTAAASTADKSVFNYRSVHHFAGAALTQSLLDYLAYDAITFDVMARFDEKRVVGDEVDARRSSVAQIRRGSVEVDREADRDRDFSTSSKPHDETKDEERAAIIYEAAGSVVDEDAAKTALAAQVALHQSIVEASSDAFITTSVSASSSAAPVSSPTASSGSNAAASTSSIVPVRSGQFARKSADHLLYVCVDVEEESASAAGGYDNSAVPAPAWQAVPLKTEADGSVCLRVTSLKRKKFVISLLQMDGDEQFIVESLASVSLKFLGKVRSGASSSEKGVGVNMLESDASSNPSFTSLTILEQFAHTSHRLLVATVDFNSYLLDHDFFREETKDGDRILLQLSIQLYFSKTTQVVKLEPELHLKNYKKNASGGIFQSFSVASSAFNSLTSTAALGDSDRLPRLGRHYRIGRWSTRESIETVYREHQRRLLLTQSRVRFEQMHQFSAFSKSVHEQALKIEKESMSLGESMKDREVKKMPREILKNAQLMAKQNVDSCIKISRAPGANHGVTSLPSPTNTTGSSFSSSSPSSAVGVGFNVAALVSAAASAAGSSQNSSGIQVVVETIPRATGLKCGFLQKQSGMAKAGAAAAAASSSSAAADGAASGALSPTSVASPEPLSSPTASSVSGGKWSPKWFVLRPPYLFYYTRKDDLREKGIIHLFQAKFEINNETAEEDKSKRQTPMNCFFIHTNTRSYHLQAASEREMNSWLRSMATAEQLEALGLNANTNPGNNNNIVTGNRASIMQSPKRPTHAHTLSDM